MGLVIQLFVLVCSVLHLYFMLQIVNILREIKNERLLIAQINDGQKWV